VKAPKVRLYIRVRLPDGHHAYLKPAWNRNRTCGQAMPWWVDSRRRTPMASTTCASSVAISVSGRPLVPMGDAAVVAVQNLEHDLQSISLGRSAPSPAPGVPATVSLDAAIKSYVSQLGLFRAPKTVHEAKRILELFAKPFPEKAIQTITREDLLDHMASLQQGGLGLRTISNHITRIGALLRRHKIVDLLSREDKPQYDEPEVEAYDSDELAALFSAATPEETHGMLTPTEEMPRCWRLHYADEVSFHLDSLPCVGEEQTVIQALVAHRVPIELARRAVAITDKRHPEYTVITNKWLSSNPRGFARWFEEHTRVYAEPRLRELVEMKKFSSVEEVPPYQWRTPIQRSIQLLKRHRDVMFSEEPELAPSQ
jgi:hypothetical protein